MSDNTRIEWADASWSPITGCTPISEGCQNCYARRMANRLRGRHGYPKNDPFRPGTVHGRKLREPFKWRTPRRIFVCSMGDLFHGAVLGSDITDVFHSISANPRHTYMILTKRPEVMREFFRYYTCARSDRVSLVNWPWPNVWLGVTAENQKRADERIPVLLQIPAAVRFVSIEPMLSAITLRDWIYDPHNLQWVICGGETGPGARMMHWDWVNDVRDQCEAAGVPFFFKKWGDYYRRNRELLPVVRDVQMPRQFPEAKHRRKR